MARAAFVRDLSASLHDFFGPFGPMSKGKKRKAKDELMRFCAVCYGKTDLALHPGANRFCRNEACEAMGRPQMGVKSSVKISVEAPSAEEGKLEAGAPAVPAAEDDCVELVEEPETAEDAMLRALSDNSLSLLIEKCKTSVAELDAEYNAITFKRAAIVDQLHTAERESKFRALEAMRAKIDVTKPARPTLIKLLSMLRKYGELFDRHPVCRVKYDPEAVTCERRRGCYREQVEIMSDGKVFRDGVISCNLVKDHPRDWKL